MNSQVEMSQKLLDHLRGLKASILSHNDKETAERLCDVLGALVSDMEPATVAHYCNIVKQFKGYATGSFLGMVCDQCITGWNSGSKEVVVTALDEQKIQEIYNMIRDYIDIAIMLLNTLHKIPREELIDFIHRTSGYITFLTNDIK